MIKITNIIFFIFSLLFSTSAYSDGFSYNSISKRHGGLPLSKKQVENAKIQGECIVGLKNLGTEKKGKFDAVTEWINFRGAALLWRKSPCEVLVTMEVAREKLQNSHHSR